VEIIYQYPRMALVGCVTHVAAFHRWLYHWGNHKARFDCVFWESPWRAVCTLDPHDCSL